MIRIEIFLLREKILGIILERPKVLKNMGRVSEPKVFWIIDGLLL